MKCQFCGYDIKKSKGCLNSETRYNGKMAHKGCLEKHLIRSKGDEK